MNDLPWIKYEPTRMFVDLIGLSVWAKVSHVALFNKTLINDGPPLNDNDGLRDITGCPASEWDRVKHELMGKGWIETPKYFLHRGTIKTLNEAKETFVANQNRTAAANRITTRYVLQPPDPETGCVTYIVTEIVTPSVTAGVKNNVTRLQEQLHKQGDSLSPIGDKEVATSKKFQKPTIEAMELHAAKIGLPKGHGESAWHFYESKGWKVGNQPMKSWQSALVTWKKRWEEKNRPELNTNHNGNARKNPGPINQRLHGQTQQLAERKATLAAAIAASED